MPAILDDVSPIERMKLSAELVTLSKQLATEKAKESPAKMALMSLSSKIIQIRSSLGALVKPVVAEVPAPANLEAGEYGMNKGEGRVTREKLNAEVVAIVEQIRSGALSPSALTADQVVLFKKYSGKGGLTENSQFEYYTPPHVAAGTWDILAENGFRNGNVLEPSTGAGVFSDTKPAGTIISGAELDPIGATVNQALHPEDKIDNVAFESMVMRTDDNTFDACIGNVPFGERGATAHIDKSYNKEKRIELYFLRRVIDKVRPGGLIALVVPTSIIGKKTLAKFRSEISLKAEFLGAHKLPSKTFQNQGTSVVTDIIVMRKHPADVLAKISGLSVQKLKEANVLWPEFIEGKYWLGEGKKFIHGTYSIAGVDAFRPGEESVIADADMTNESLKKQLARRFDSRIDWEMLDAAEPVINYYAEGDVKFINGRQMSMKDGRWTEVIAHMDNDTTLDAAKFGAASLEQLRAILATPSGMLGITAAQAYKAYKTYPGLFSDWQKQAVEFSMSQPKEKFYEFAYRGSLLGSMVTDYSMGADATDRDRVVALLKSEFERNGHPTTAKGMMLDGAMSRSFGVYLASVDKKGKVADNVAGNVVSVKGYSDDNILSIVEMLERTTNKPIELADVAALYVGKLPLKTWGDIADVQGIAITPQGFVSTTRVYCSGDAYQKIDELQSAMVKEKDARLKEHWNGLISLLSQKVRRVAIGAISFGLRDKWIKPEYREEFLEANGWGVKFKADAVDEDADTGSLTVGVWAAATQNRFGKQLVKYMNGKSIAHGLTTSDSYGTKEEQRDDMQLKINALEEQFRFYMQAHPDATEIETAYNMTFNRNIRQDYDKAPLGLKGVDAGVVLHDYQNAGVRRLVHKGSGILGYDVGLGKSFTALAYSVYDRQMGNSKKHCTVVPKSVLANWYNESKRLLGNHDNVLFVGFEPKRDKLGEIVQEPVMDENNKQKINQHTGLAEFQDVLVEDSRDELFAKMHRIPMMDSGLVIMTQENFGRIPLKEETITRYGEDWVARHMTSDGKIQKMAENAKAVSSYADEKKKAAIENKMYAEGTDKKNQLPYFEDMGFERVMVDEGHQFKGSFSISGMDQTAYLSNPGESQRGQDMALKMSHIREANQGKGAILLTATPVANSPIEIYNMLMFVLPPGALDKFGIYTPDDFVRFFGVIDSVDKLKIDGSTKSMDGLKGFRNLNALRQLFAEYADMKDAKDVDPEGTRLKLPDATLVKSQCDMTDEQQAAYNALREEAKMSGNPAKVKSGEARPMFAIIRDMDRVTADIDLYNKTMTFLFKAADEGKLKNLIDALPASLEFEAREDEFGEIIKTKKKANSNSARGEDSRFIVVKKQEKYKISGDALSYVAPEDYEAEIVSRLKTFGIEYVSHPLQPKYAVLVDNIKAELAGGGKQLIFTEEKSQHDKLERMLVNNLPLDEIRIAIINASTASGEKLQEIVDAYTRGDYELIICNKKAEVGVNLQKGTSAVHHMTLPWTPASIQQRNGRAVRQGNTIAGGVRVYFYQGKGTFDDYRLDLLNRKAGWIGALLNEESTDDEYENGDAVSDLDQAALLSDNPEEFLAKMAAGKAAKDAEAKQRRIKDVKAVLMRSISTKLFLTEFDDRKAKAKADLDHKMELAIKSVEKSIEENGEDHITTTRRKAALSKLGRDAERFDGEWAAKKGTSEVLLQQQKSAMRASESRGELPFPAALIETPNAVISRTGVVIYVDGVYETTQPSGRKLVFKVRSVDGDDVTAEAYVGGSGTQIYSIERLFTESTHEAYYDESELLLQRALTTPMNYANLAKTLTKEVFLEHADQVSINDYGLFRADSGELSMGNFRNGGALVYPDQTDKKLLNEVANIYGEHLRDYDYSVESALRYVMPALFGDDWKAGVSAYVKTAKPEDIKAKAVEFLTPYLTLTELKTELDVVAAIEKLDDADRIVSSAISEWMTAQEFVNISDVDEVSDPLVEAELAKLRLKLREVRAAESDRAEKAKLNAIKADPRYRELYPDDADRFAAMGITATYNTEDVGYKKAFDWLFLKDRNGKNGKLYFAKEIMKNRLRATFVGSKNVPYSSPFADTWAVPSSTNIAELLDILE